MRPRNGWWGTTRADEDDQIGAVKLPHKSSPVADPTTSSSSQLRRVERSAADPRTSCDIMAGSARSR